MVLPSLKYQWFRFARSVKAHPRRVMLALLAGLSGFAVTAFGIAPMAPDTDTLPRRLLTEAVTPADLPGQLEALALQELHLHRSTVTRTSDTADSLLRRLGAADPAAASFLRRDREALRLIDGQAGKMVQARLADDGTLLDLVARFAALDASRETTHFTRLTIKRVAGRFISSLETAPLQTQVRLGSGSVTSTLWAAADDARLPETIAAQMIDIFAGDIDFHRELRKGDTFSVAFEALTADDQPITWNDATGRVLAAEYTNKGRRFQAVWYTDAATSKGAYFTLDGKSRRRPFLASPLEFSRITSGFAMRMNPVLQTWQAHKGVDYGAPTGTPVKTVGAGTVEFAGRQQGYGNVVKVLHSGNKSTLYAHLSRIDVKQGQTLAQGQVIGAVGSTGWSTGPHLHFEFHVNGQVQDPLEVASTLETFSIEASARPRFGMVALAARRQLTAATSMSRFRGDAE